MSLWHLPQDLRLPNFPDPSWPPSPPASPSLLLFTLYFCCVSLAFTVFQRLTITSAEGPAEWTAALKAAMLCGDSADWMWHSKLPRPEHTVITYACIIYKRAVTAKFNSQRKYRLCFPVWWLQILTKHHSLISGLKSDVSALLHSTRTHGLWVWECGRHSRLY